jgi:hypothetical protein
VDTKQFVASLVSSLAWPGAVVAIALLFRRQLAQLLTGSLKRLKAGPVEFEFERVLPSVQARLADEATTSPAPPAPVAPTPASGTLPGSMAPSPQPAVEPELEPPELFAFRERLEKSGSAPDSWLQQWVDRSAAAAPVREELAGVAATQPSAAVLAAHARLARVLRALESLFDPAMAKKLSPPSLAYALVKRGVLSDAVADAVLELTTLRNLVAHDEHASLTPAVALDYLDSVDAVIAAIAATLKPKDGRSGR